MPDITMCASQVCTKTKECYRHHDSGTKYSYRQSVCDFTPPKNEDCKYFWSKD